MKNILVIIFTASFVLLFAQHNNPPLLNQCTSYIEVPLRTHTHIPEDECYYLKDSNNELQDYIGTWTGAWNNKTFIITFSKMTTYFNPFFKYYEDILIAKFKVLNNSGGVLFDNTSLPDYNAKVKGGGFIKDELKYSMRYVDEDICNINGGIEINFINPIKTQLNWKYSQNAKMIYPNCQYYGSANFPDPLPRSIVLTKQ